MAGEPTNLLFMNYRPNPHRKQSFEEIEANHIYFATRHFPRISCSHGHRCTVCKTTGLPNGGFGGKSNMAEGVQSSHPDPERIAKIMRHRGERPQTQTATSVSRLKELQRAPVKIENRLREKLKDLWDVKKEYHAEVKEVDESSLKKVGVVNAISRSEQSRRRKREASTFHLRSATGNLNL